MNAHAVPRIDGDGRVQVNLAELIAMRARVSRAPVSASVVRTVTHGRQASRLHGRGMDYAESRAYQPGDDIRRIDWRLTARSGRMHSKLFEEEREGRLLILLDQNAGMRFGTQTRFKSVQAARAVALASWYAVRAGDKVGLLGFGGSRQQVRAQGGPHGALTIAGALAAWDARREGSPPESLTSALQRAGRAAHGARRILLVSDGFSCDSDTRGTLLGLARRAEILVLGVADAMEITAPPPGRYPLAHDGERFDVELRGDRAREAFVQALGAGHRKLEALADGLGLRHRTIDTTVDPFDSVSYLLGDGRRR